MKAILYDCPDHPQVRYRFPVMRIFDGRNMVAQIVLLDENWQQICRLLADGVGATLEYVGPSKSPEPDRTIDPGAVYDVPAELVHAKDRNQLALF